MTTKRERSRAARAQLAQPKPPPTPAELKTFRLGELQIVQENLLSLWGTLERIVDKIPADEVDEVHRYRKLYDSTHELINAIDAVLEGEDEET